MAFEDAFQSALGRWHAGDPDGAIEALQALLVCHPESRPVHGMLGSYLCMQGRFEEALPHSQRTVDTAPASQLASRVHFHALYGLGRNKDAVAELRRFHAVAESEEERAEWAVLIADLEAAASA